MAQHSGQSDTLVPLSSYSIFFLEAPAMAEYAVHQTTGRNSLRRVSQFGTQYLHTLAHHVLTALDWQTARQLSL
jgi:hypothetical protein